MQENSYILFSSDTDPNHLIDKNSLDIKDNGAIQMTFNAKQGIALVRRGRNYFLSLLTINQTKKKKSFLVKQ